MKILVPFKSVPDPYAGPGGAAKSVVNPFDEIAIEEALRMRERGDATEIVGVSIGPAAVEEQIRSALAMGVEQTIFSFGGELDHDSTYTARDIINSKQNVEARKWYEDACVAKTKTRT